jgi:hypothetical protein
LHFVLQHDGNTRQTKKKKRLQLCSTQLQVPKSSLSRLADFFHQQLPGYGLLSADNKMQSAKLRTLSRLAVFFIYQWGLVLLKKKAAINKAPLLGVVDARFPVIAHHRCAHDSPYTVWAPHRAYLFVEAFAP